MLNFNFFVKRVFDIIISLIAVVILIPLWIVVAVAIKLDSKGPIFFKQGRRTKDGKVFNMLKFRTMVVNAEKMESGLFTYKNDSRITKVGHFLRKTSIDELPQFLNVFFGDMSLVGPRPIVTYELGDFDTLNNKYKKRFQVKGGITGLAQSKGRNNNSWEEKVLWDNKYVDLFVKDGICIDIKILWWSILTVLTKQNIYETKLRNDLSDKESANLTDEEIKRIAHLCDD